MAGGLDGGGSMGGGHGQWRASTARAELQHRMEFEKKAGAPLRAGGSEMVGDGQMVQVGAWSEAQARWTQNAVHDAQQRQSCRYHTW